MPRRVELSKRIHEIEANFLNKFDRLADQIVGKIMVKIRTLGCDVLELKKEIDSLESSVKVLNDLVETLRREKVALTAENKALRTENTTLSLKADDLEQYTRMTHVEIRGVPCTQG